MILADSHLHLDRYNLTTVGLLLARARAAGVRYFLTVGVDLASSRRAQTRAWQCRNVYAAVGLHPTFLRPDLGPDDVAGLLAALRDLAQRSPAIVAIGEGGIDLLEAQAPLDLQRQAFRLQLQLARELRLPFILHQQNAEQECQQILQDERGTSGQGGDILVHYFVGDGESAKRWLELGCALSVGKPVTRSEQATLREAVAAIPLERLLLETDTYPLPGRTTEPADIRQIAEAVAKLKQLPLEAIAEETTANFRRLFRIS